MGLLDAPLRAAAAVVVNTLGGSVVVRIRTLGEYDLDTRTGADGFVDVSGKGMFANKSVMGKKEVVRDNNTEATMEGRFLLLAAADWEVVPTLEHLIFVDGKEYTIVDIETTRASDEAVIYELELRGPQ